MLLTRTRTVSRCSRCPIVIAFAGPLDAVHLFVKDSSELEEWKSNIQNHVHPDTMLWIGYPKEEFKNEIRYIATRCGI